MSVTIYMPTSNNIPNTSVIYSLSRVIFAYKIEASQGEKKSDGVAKTIV